MRQLRASRPFSRTKALEVQVGIDIHTDKKRIVLLVSSIAVLICGAANGQVLSLSYDFNTPAANARSSWGQEPKEVSRGLAFGLGLHNKSLFTRSSPLRFGLEFGYQRLTVGVPGFPGSDTSYSAFSVLGSADRRVVGGSSINLSVGVALGLSFLKDNRDCNAPFCDLPGSVILVTPRIKVGVRVSNKVATYFDVRWGAFMSDRGNTYPYKSGIVIAIGIEHFSGSGGNQGDDF